MANNYSQFSEMLFDNLTQEEKYWISDYGHLDADIDEDLEIIKRDFPEVEEGSSWPGFEFKFEDNRLWIYAEESYDLENTALFLQAFIRKFRPKEIVSISAAWYCSKLRVGEFGGEFLVVAANHKVIMNTQDMASKIVKEIAALNMRG